MEKFCDVTVFWWRFTVTLLKWRHSSFFKLNFVVTKTTIWVIHATSGHQIEG